MAMTLYYSPGACSLAAHMVLRVTGADFDARRIAIADGANRQPEYLAINPRGRVPALDVDGEILTESGAILTYLGVRFPESGVLPLNNLLQLGRCEELLAFYVASVHIAFAQYWRPERFSEEPSSHLAIKQGGRRNILRYFDEIEGLIADNDWLVGGHFTIADTYPLIFYRWGRRIGFDMSAYRQWTGHSVRMLALPAVAHTIAAEGLAITDFVEEKGT